MVPFKKSWADIALLKKPTKISQSILRSSSILDLNPRLCGSIGIEKLDKVPPDENWIQIQSYNDVHNSPLQVRSIAHYKYALWFQLQSKRIEKLFHACGRGCVYCSCCHHICMSGSHTYRTPTFRGELVLRLIQWEIRLVPDEFTKILSPLLVWQFRNKTNEVGQLHECNYE